MGLFHNSKNAPGETNPPTPHQPIFDMTTFQGLTATQWRNRINEYNPGMYSKEFLKDKTAKELAQIQNGKSYGVSESKSVSAIRAKLEAIKKQKVSAIKKEKSASDSVQQLLAALSKPDKAPVRKPKAPACKPAKAKDETADLIKKLIGALQSAQANNPKAKWDPDSDVEEESDESEEE